MIVYEKTINHLVSFDRGVRALTYKISGFYYEHNCVKIYIIANLTAQEQTDLDDYVNTFNDVYDPIDVTEQMISYQQLLGEQIIVALKVRNRAEGITAEQSTHYLIRTEDNLLMLKEGLLESAKEVSEAIIPDDMTETYHFLTQPRIDAVIADIDAALIKVDTKLLELIA